MSKIFSGIEVSNKICEKIKLDVENLHKNNISPCLAILRVGAKEDDIAYERGAKKKMETLGIECKNVVLAETISQKELEDEILKLNLDTNVHGILMLRPLPKSFDEDKIRNLIDIKKDVDCMSNQALSKVFIGDKNAFAPCTASAVMEMLDYYKVDLAGKDVVILGRSTVVGRPLSMLLLNANATPTICHTKTLNLNEKCKNADIIVAAIGRAKFLKKDKVSPKSIVIDVGINFLEGKLVGDVDFDEVESEVTAISPVPRGVGSITTSVLAKNVVTSAKRLLD